MNPLGGALIGGFAGFVLESIVRGQYFESPAWDGAPVPFAPAYAAGGALHTLISPVIAGAPWPARGLLYASAFTLLEYGACQMDRGTGHRTWAYGPDGDCVDLKHSAAWGVLGLVAEPMLR
jgi:hypothetical protein